MRRLYATANRRWLKPNGESIAGSEVIARHFGLSGRIIVCFVNGLACVNTKRKHLREDVLWRLLIFSPYRVLLVRRYIIYIYRTVEEHR